MIGVVADDLTGAAELAGVGHRYGLTAEVIVGGKCKGNAELVCVDTDSRSCKPDEAARRAAQAARNLRKAGACWVYKKIDSVLRGNVLAEVNAVQQALKLPSTLLLPANPQFGRVIRDGRYFVKGKPINETDFARDPEHPRLSSNVLEMLGATAKRPVTIRHPGSALSTSGIVLGEVSSSADVHEWASRHTFESLPAGGVEFFEALLRKVESANHRRPVRQQPGVTAGASNGRELFVCGSTSDYTDEFVRNARNNRTPVFSIIQLGATDFSYSKKSADTLIEQALVQLKGQPRVVLAIGRPLLERPNVARQLTKYLVKMAIEVIARGRPRHVYAEGGATAAELARRLEWKRMRVINEFAPGVITLRSSGREFPTLTIKPGSYPGWPTV